MTGEDFLERVTFWSFLRELVGGSMWRYASEQVRWEGNPKVVRKGSKNRQYIKYRFVECEQGLMAGKNYSKHKMKLVECNTVNWRRQKWDTLQSNLEQMEGRKKWRAEISNCKRL